MLPTLCLLAAALLVPPGDAAAARAVAPADAALAAAGEYSAAHGGHALVVLFGGRRVFERYDGTGAADRPHMLASGSKSFVGVAAVAAVRDGLLNLDDPASGGIPAWRDDPLKAAVTYRQLLTLTGGLTPAGRGAAARTPSWEAIAAAPMTGEPGGQFAYGAYQLNAFAHALEGLLGGETFERYLERRLFRPLGVTVEWRFRCADGHPQVGGGAFMTARDWATFGEFVRLGGRWDGRELVDAKLLAECFRGTGANPAYGLTWWLKRPVSPALRRRSTVLSSEWADAVNSPALPDDLVAALGAGKQRLYVIPSRGLVVARHGGFGRGFEDTALLGLLLGDGAGRAERRQPSPSR